eukprot:TRINITY_DN32602_c0_g1_i1.p1 TRINITY_DN32602_c0_g1~~TRINITY_DN32602_c0_g1_i1.p1  ORF type:complete len:269 (-),score=50.57 TRINITY_DN32602_c0_g1_i1:51-800(-)
MPTKLNIGIGAQDIGRRGGGYRGAATSGGDACRSPSLGTRTTVSERRAPQMLHSDSDGSESGSSRSSSVVGRTQVFDAVVAPRSPASPKWDLMERELEDANKESLPVAQGPSLQACSPRLRKSCKGLQKRPKTRLATVFVKKRCGPDDPEFNDREVIEEKLVCSAQKVNAAELRQHLFEKYEDGTVHNVKAVHLLRLGPEGYATYDHQKEIGRAWQNGEQLPEGSECLGNSADRPLVWMAYRHVLRSWL